MRYSYDSLQSVDAVLTNLLLVNSRLEVRRLEFASICFPLASINEVIESFLTNKAPVILDTCRCQRYNFYDRCSDLPITSDISRTNMMLDSLFVVSISKYSRNIRSQEPSIALVVCDDG